MSSGLRLFLSPYKLKANNQMFVFLHVKRTSSASIKIMEYLLGFMVPSNEKPQVLITFKLLSITVQSEK